MSAVEDGLRVVRLAEEREPSRCVRIDVENAMLAEALAATAGRAGWVGVPGREAGEVLVTDGVPARTADQWPAHDVVTVCDPTPLGARRAVDAVSELLVTAVVCSDQPADLASALEGLDSGRVSIPRRVVELAARMPELTERQLAMMAGVAAGQQNAAVGAGVGLSAKSVKRELGVLYATLDASNRSMLVAKALDLGVRPRALRP